MFGAAFDGVVIRRFWGFIRPYRRMMFIAVIVNAMQQEETPARLPAVAEGAKAALAQRP